MKKGLRLLTLLCVACGAATAFSALPGQISPAGARDVMSQIRALQEQARQAAIHCEGDERVAEIYGEIDLLMSQRPRDERNPLDQGGENCATATVISALPYCDSGTTTGYADDYTPPSDCGNSTAGDVVYVYTSPIDQLVGVSLCGSAYNTILYVWEGCPGPAPSHVVCCDDDSPICGPQSCCPNVFMRMGMTYYIIVDGAGTADGNYLIHVGSAGACPGDVCGSCVVSCPPGATPEGEGCPAGNPDYYNAACFWFPFSATPISCGEVYCGSGWNDTYTDHDAYIITITARDSLRWCMFAEFDVQMDVHQFFSAG